MVNVIGLGYIGFPTALMLASHGVEVVGTDYNPELISILKEGKITFKEDGVEEQFSVALRSGIRFSIKYQLADIYIVSVPSPYDSVSKKVDASYVVDAVREILNVCPKKAVIVIESTISPGTIDKYIRPVIEEKGITIGQEIYLAHAPERIIPGSMIHELVHNNRTIGVDDEKIGEKIKELYSSFCQGEIIVTDIRTAEMTKVVENAFRDINIAYANELAKICRSDGMDVYEIIRIANKHPRVNILSPGPGVGGHCISVDPWFLVGDYPGLANIILTARKINDSMPEFVLERTAEIMKEHGINSISEIGFYGLTYKAEVDDIRESPTLQILECMRKHLAQGVKVYDPFIKEKIVDNQIFELKEFIDSVEMIVIMVAHKEIMYNQYMMQNKVVFDTCNAVTGTHVYRL